MEAISTLPRPASLAQVRKIDWSAVSTWLLGFGLIVYLGLKGGGYTPLVRDQVGIAVWWIALGGTLVGALPRRRLGIPAWLTLGLFAAVVAWTALSLGWTETTDKTMADLARVATYLGIFVLALFIRDSKGARRMVAAVGAGIAFVSIVALLSRLHPAWFPNAHETADLLGYGENRLAYPLNYWNGDAALAAIGIPLVLYLATSARTIAVQALAASALPMMGLTIYLTFSRGGTLMTALALVVFLALAHDRLPKAATVLVAGAGAAILIAATGQREALDAGLVGPQARDQGNQMLAMTIVVCAGVGLIQAGLALALRQGRRPAWSRPSPRFSLSLLGGALAVATIAALALGLPGKATSTWHDFKQAEPITNGPARFESFSSNGRYPFWSSAIDQNATKPLTGTGSGSFESWWARHGTGGFVQDAHSLYFETLGELGIVGLALVVGFLGWVLAAGARRYIHTARERRTQLAAALAGCASFCLGAGFDWLWELAVIPIAFLLLASVLVGLGERGRKAQLPLLARVVGAGIGLAAIAAISIPLSAATSIDRSQAEARASNLAGALKEAHDAQSAEPFAAAPRMQEALILEAQRRLSMAGIAARAATRREPYEWRAWIIVSRIEAERGKAAASVAAYRKARALNPQSALFSR